MTAVLLCNQTTHTIMAPIVPVKIMTQPYQYSSFSLFFVKSVCTPIWDFATRRHLQHFVGSSYLSFCVWLTPRVRYSLCPIGNFSRRSSQGATGRLRTNKARANILPAFPIPIFNLFSFLLIE